MLLVFFLALQLTAQRPGRAPVPAPRNIPETNPYSSAAHVDAGRKLYQGRCGHCHGQNGEGGRGATLTGRLRHGATDRDLFLVIRNGVPNTEMPGSRLPEADVWRMAAYLRQLGGQGEPEQPAGDVAAGARVYEKNGCAQCHIAGGSGAFLGPDLTDIGARRPPRHLRQSIVEPAADLPLDFRTVAVTTAAGRSISGILLNEDEYSVHLRDLSGNLQSFLKKELKDMKIPLQSVMPAYASLAKVDLDNLVAYLSSLRPGSGDTTWRFDRLDGIGGHRTTILGDPKVIDSPLGKAMEFDGVDDAVFIDNHPLAGAKAFTWEAVFRPDGGNFEQRWFHLSERDTENRMLFEIRVVEGKWYLDSFVQSGTASKALMNRTALHPLGAWHHVASVYDGKEFRNYVDGVLEGSAAVEFAPQGPGQTSVGVRINKVHYFKGAVHLARFTRRALAPGEFLRSPAKR